MAMVELDVRIWPAIATVTLKVSPISINNSPDIRRDIIEESAVITSASLINKGLLPGFIPSPLLTS